MRRDVDIADLCEFTTGVELPFVAEKSAVHQLHGCRPRHGSPIWACTSWLDL